MGLAWLFVFTSGRLHYQMALLSDYSSYFKLDFDFSRMNVELHGSPSGSRLVCLTYTTRLTPNIAGHISTF